MTIIAFTISVLFSQISCDETPHEFRVADNTYSLRISSSDVTTRFGRERLVRYSVYENGKFIHGENRDCGRVFTCPYEQPVEIKGVHSNKRQIGWMISGGGVCGNTYSLRNELIIPIIKHSPGFMNRTFVSKSDPIFFPTEGGAEVCYWQQNWGGGGTATSFFVPRKLLIGTHAIRKGDVFENLEKFEPSTDDDYLQPGFLSLFVAGLEDANPELMRYAIQNYYKGEDQEWYEVHIKDGSLEGVELLAQKVEGLRSLHQDVKWCVSWDDEFIKRPEVEKQ